MKPWTALPLGYALFYLSLYAVSPNLLDNLSEIFPQGNGILGILFIASLIKIVMRFFSHSQSAKRCSKRTTSMKPSKIDDVEIDKEITEDKKERKLLKGKTANVTKTRNQQP